MRAKLTLQFVFTLIFTLFIATNAPASGLKPFTKADVPHRPDYADNAHWLALPDQPGTHPVDVFWVYPTILTDDVHWLMGTANQSLREKTAHTLLTQASIFQGRANIYAPLYRQMNIAALALQEAEKNGIRKYGEEDVLRAFTYYLEHLNQGRPFFLAGHSQGSNLLTLLAVKNWGTTGAEKRLIAAYLIGWSITREDLEANPALAICERPDQTGCFISYNTMAAGRQRSAPTLLPNAVGVNPLTWTVSSELAPASVNMGARFFDKDGSYTDVAQFTSAQLIEGGLVVSPIDPALVQSDLIGFPEGVYHVFDYSLFFHNLQENVKPAFLHSHLNDQAHPLYLEKSPNE